MKSIRLSLLVYFLVLLALALGAVSLFVYRTTQQTLQAKEESTRALLLAQHETRCNTVKEELDNRMLRRAQTLANMAQSQWGFTRYEVHGLRLWSGGFHFEPFFMLTLWSVNGPENRIVGDPPYRPPSSLVIRFADDVVLAPELEGSEREYFQIYSEAGRSLQHSHSLGDDSFTLDDDLRARIGLFEWSFDDTELAADLPLRRVTLKAPVSKSRFVMGGNPSPRRGTPPPSTPRPPPSGRVTLSDVRSSPNIYIQYASDTSKRDAILEKYQEDLDSDLAKLQAESHTTLVSLRWRLLWLGLATFSATVAGGFFLVWLGLLPLRRLSDAVSRVSPKDFRLPFDEPHLPGELRPIVEHLNQTLQMLKRAFAREKQAAADISHELRTPLAALLTTIDVALRKPRSPEEYRELLEDCRASGQQMNQLVERMLALARLDAGVDLLRPQQVDVAVLAEQCVSLVRPLAEARGLSLEVQPQAPTTMIADPVKLREILTNLLHNAIEYNRPNGTVSVTVQRQNGHVAMEVHDTGIGIAAEECEHIFERFYRADPSRQADGLHAGLGLSIVKGYVDLMGGTIAVESTEGQGSTFRVQLPVRG